LVLVLTILPLLYFTFRWDARMPPPDELSLLLADKTTWIGAWATGFVERLFTSFLKLFLVLLIVVALAYAALQALGLWVDRAPKPQSALRVLTGRPYRVERTEEYQQEMHRWGANAMISPLRAGLSMFPMLGFLGTVAGLSTAIRDLPAAVQDNALLGPVLDSLYVAFDTTLLGLVGAIICLLATRLLEDHIDMTRLAHETH